MARTLLEVRMVVLFAVAVGNELATVPLVVLLDDVPLVMLE